MHKPIVQVVVGILQRYNINQYTNQTNIEYLFGQRPQGKPYAGYWEFAGGKIEAQETHLEALKRELHEELGININIRDKEQFIHYLDSMTYDYEHACVELHFYNITQWQGTPKGLEGQTLTWVSTDNCPQPILPSLAYILPLLKN
jgi:8-oxo-dGTP diphosphatase